jgi:hypothetical protein
MAWSTAATTLSSSTPTSSSEALVAQDQNGNDLRSVYPIMGVNRLYSSLKIQDNEAYSTENLYPYEAGLLKQRKGCRFSFYGVQNPLSLVDTTNLLPSSCVGLDNTGSPEYWAMLSTLSASGNDTRLWAINRPTYLSKSFQMSATQPTKLRIPMVRFGQYVIASHAQYGTSDQPITAFNTIFATFDNTTPTFTDNAGGVEVAPKVLGVYKNRMVYANFDTNRRKATLVFSDPNNYTYVGTGATQIVDLDADTRTLDIKEMAGDEIVAVKSFMQSAVGTPSQLALLILGRHSAFIMTGDPGLTTDADPTGTAEVLKIQIPCGCVGPATLVETPYGLVWTGPDDVWAFDVGQLPRRIGSKIRPVIEDANAAEYGWLWHAIYDSETGSYQLAVTTNQSTASTHKVCSEQWWVDLRDGVPRSWVEARWYGPQVPKIAAYRSTAPVEGSYLMTSLRWSDNNPRPYAVLAAFNATDFAANAYNASLVFAEMNVQEGYDSALTSLDETPSDNPPTVAIGNEITWEVITKTYPMTEGLVGGTFMGVEFLGWTQKSSRISCEAIIDGGRIKRATGISMDQTWFDDLIDLEDETHEFQALAINPDAGYSMNGKLVQLRIYSTAGYCIPENGAMNGITLVYDNTGYPLLSGTIFNTIGAGFFSDLKAFLDNLIARLNTLVGGGFAWEHNFGAATEASRPEFVAINTDDPQWTLLNDNALTTGFEDYQKKSRLLAQYLGFPSGSDLGPAVTNTADSAVRWRVSSAFELADMVMKIAVFGRRPSGGEREF